REAALKTSIKTGPVDPPVKVEGGGEQPATEPEVSEPVVKSEDASASQQPNPENAANTAMQVDGMEAAQQLPGYLSISAFPDQKAAYENVAHLFRKGYEMMDDKISLVERSIIMGGNRAMKKMKKKSTGMEDGRDDTPDVDEQLYCFCRQVSYGEMIACDGEGVWHCDDCLAALQNRQIQAEAQAEDVDDFANAAQRRQKKKTKR
ncbi:hypothetical protein HK101_001019, partial [Irineochytrium annulatum]